MRTFDLPRISALFLAVAIAARFRRRTEARRLALPFMEEGRRAACSAGFGKDAVTDDVHGIRVTDQYRWLEDAQSEKTSAWIDAQMKYTESI